MFKNYAEFLKANGATDDEIKILDTPVARKGFEAMQAADARAVAAETARATDRKALEDWRDEKVIPEFQDMQNQLIAAQAEAARSKAAILKMQELGLVDVAKTMGYTPDPPPNAAGNGAPKDFDPSKYVTMDQVTQIAQSEGDAIALAQDIAAEHSALFPDKKLNFRQLRAAALAARQPVEQYWMSTYGVAAAREKRDTDSRIAYETKLRTEGATAERERLATQYGNPDLRPLSPSTSPFTKDPARGREAQPWEVSDRSNERVQRATKAILDMQSGTGRTN